MTRVRFPAHELSPGDRAPNFVLPDSEGRMRMFYERTRGRPVALVFFGAGPRAAAAMDALAARAADLEAAGIDVFAIARGDGAALPFLVWRDPERAITEGYFKAAGLAPGDTAEAAVAFALDANQRLLAIVRGDDLADRLCALYADQPPAPAAMRLATSAPVLLLPRLLDAAMCEDLIALWEREGHEEGTVASLVGGRQVERVYAAKKRRLDHKIMDPLLTRHLQEVVGRRVAPEVHKAFQFEKFRFDRFLVVCYDAARGDYFRPHRDNLTPATADRRFALTVNLNPDDYEGGDLVFPEYGPHGYAAGPGGGVLFSCSLIHEARPPTRGRRFALLTFLRDLPARR